MKDAVTIHEIVESALAKQMRSTLAAKSRLQPLDADTLKTASVDTEADNDAEMLADTFRTRLAPTDALADAEIAALASVRRRMLIDAVDVTAAVAAIETCLSVREAIGAAAMG